jgi:hypothetical protein
MGGMGVCVHRPQSLAHTVQSNIFKVELIIWTKIEIKLHKISISKICYGDLASQLAHLTTLMGRKFLNHLIL